jgi:GntR family transcriptional regulator
MTEGATVPNWLDELADSEVDLTNGGPLHAQLELVVRSRITNGSLPPGAQLPTEAELQRKFGISRSVVRQALQSLAVDGLVQRGRGRGSVVAPRGEYHRLVQRIPGLSTQLTEVTTRVLSLKPERDAVAEASLGVKEITGLRRLRSTAGEPLALIHTWLPRQLAEGLTAGELTDTSLHAKMRQICGIVIVSGRRQVRAVEASLAVASFLGVPAGAPLLLLEGTSFDGAGNPVEFFRTWHRADRIVFDIDVLKGPDAEPTPEPASPAASSNAPPETGAARAGLASRARALSLDLLNFSDHLEYPER